MSRSLETFRAWCWDRAAEPDADPLWTVLAREVDAYIARDPDVISTVPEPTGPEQEVLW